MQSMKREKRSYILAIQIMVLVFITILERSNITICGERGMGRQCKIIRKDAMRIKELAEEKKVGEEKELAAEKKVEKVGEKKEVGEEKTVAEEKENGQKANVNKENAKKTETKKLVALTFDDGPSEYTEHILKTLKQYHVVATFFVIGEQVEQYPEIIQQEANAGCEIGNHTYEHKVLTDLNAEQMWLQIHKTSDVIENLTGKAPTLMRPPCGFHDKRVDYMAEMPMILWSIDTKDWQTQNCGDTINTVLQNIKDGDIVLMHDMYGATADAVETIVPSLLEEGYQLVTVSELAELRGYVLEGGMEYSLFKVREQ